MAEKKTANLQRYAEMALKLATNPELGKAESLELHKLLYNELAPGIITLSIEENQTMQLFLETAANILLKAKGVAEIIRKEKLDALPKEKQEKLSKEWEEIQQRRIKSGVQQTIEKDPKVKEKKEKKEKEIVVRKEAAVRLSFEEKAIKAIQRMNPKLSDDDARKQLGLK